MKSSTRFLIGCVLVSLLSTPGWSQSKNPALDSMGANMARQNWKAAIDWALKAAEANPAEKYWRYLNAADFASRDQNAELALKYATLVVESEIGTNAYFGKSFIWLHQDPRWIKLMARVDQLKENQRQERIRASLPFRREQQEALAQTGQYLDSLATLKSVDVLYRRIRQGRPLHPNRRSGQYRYGWISLRDSLEFPYLVQLPPHFDSRRSYPLLVVLHGAVGQNPIVPDVADSTHTFFGWLFMEQAARSEFIVVCPYSTRRYNWMMPDDGFELVPKLVRQIKSLYSIDDQRVHVAGHSNGATGAFSYLMKQPGPFAGFAGVNNRSQVRTGGTFLRNAANRSFYNVATDYDYYFPLEGHRGVSELAKQLGVNWQNQEVGGQRSHGYLITARDSTAQAVYRQLFAYLARQQRNPFPSRLYWECDDVRHGRCDWLAIDQLDTVSARTEWHTQPNVLVSGWRRANKPEVVLDSSSQAFAFPRRSGAVEASYARNRFQLKTSGVKVVTLYLSPEMIDFNRPLEVVINEKTVFSGRVRPDRTFLLANYRREMDHQAVWTNRLQLVVP